MGLEILAAEALKHLFDIGTDILPPGQAGRCDVRHHVERKSVSGDMDVFVIHHQEGDDSDHIHECPRDFWVESVKRWATAFLMKKTTRQETDIARDILQVQDMLKPLKAGSFDLVEDFKTKWRKNIHFVVIARSFDDAERHAVAQDIASTLSSHPDHGINRFYSMDILDIMSGRGPQPLILPKPIQEEESSNDSLMRLI